MVFPPSLTEFFTMSSCVEGSCLSLGAFELVLNQETVCWVTSPFRMSRTHLVNNVNAMKCRVGSVCGLWRNILPQSAEAGQVEGNLH